MTVRHLALPIKFAVGPLIVLLTVDCSPVAPFEESFDLPVVAYVDSLHVPDISSRASIPVRLIGTIGPTSAYRFDFIQHERRDTLFRIAVWGRWQEKSGVQYEKRNIVFDTTLVLSSTRVGMHYLEALGANNKILVDSTFVY